MEFGVMASVLRMCEPEAVMGAHGLLVAMRRYAGEQVCLFNAVDRTGLVGIGL